MKKFLMFIPLLLLPACATSKKPVIVSMPRSVPGTTLSSKDAESVRYGENIKAYSIGRYVDPNDSLEMHEAHTVYRVETTAQWNLRPGPPARIPSGPVVGIIDPAHKASPVTPEIAAEVARQKMATEAVMAQGVRMNTTLNQMSQSAAATTQVAEENLRLRADLSAMDKRLEAVEEQSRKPQSEPLSTNSPSFKDTNGW
ncbi:MAG TPA: hypothetical protein VGN61_13200 [Verrucomicrobiae bacterium]|jgi:hypothetical protein